MFLTVNLLTISHVSRIQFLSFPCTINSNGFIKGGKVCNFVDHLNQMSMLAFSITWCLLSVHVSDLLT